LTESRQEQKNRSHFLPYQLAWLDDTSPVKVWDKSRRIGATYVQSYEDVRDCAKKAVPAVWFSSADESAAKEYIEYCEMWTKLFDIAARSLGQVFLDSERNIKTFTIEFANGTKIHALSSNPKAFRSKGGKVVLDEFAHHDNPNRLWAAARPCITWGFPMRILSTHNGTNTRFFKFVDAIKKKKLNWSLHTTTIQKAAADGLLDKIRGHATTQEEREAWLAELKADCFDESDWLQEYCCIPVDEATAFLPYDLITNCELDSLPKPFKPTQTELDKIDIIAAKLLAQITGELYGGMDVGRKKDLSIIWLWEKLGRQKYARLIIEMEKVLLPLQQLVLFAVLKHPRMRRFCLDSTGLGTQLGDATQLVFGPHKVEAVNFSNPVKEDLAYRIKMEMEDKTLLIPSDFEVREDFHSIRKFTTAAGNIRFDVASSDARGHADRFWAAALATLAAADARLSTPIYVATLGKREAYNIVAGYN